MKNAEDICKELFSGLYGDKFERDTIIRNIKQIQLDAIEETCKFCSENATTELTSTCIRVSKQSILNCADILKRELE